MENSFNEENAVKRHGFVTFWLYFCIVFGIIGIIMSLKTMSEVGDLLTIVAPKWYFIVSIILSFVALYGYFLLLKWKKQGFSIVVAVTVINIILSLIFLGFDWMTFLPIVGIVILYAILQISKDGVPYWKALR